MRECARQAAAKPAWMDICREADSEQLCCELPVASRFPIRLGNLSSLISHKFCLCGRKETPIERIWEKIIIRIRTKRRKDL